MGSARGWGLPGTGSEFTSFDGHTPGAAQFAYKKAVVKRANIERRSPMKTNCADNLGKVIRTARLQLLSW
jgi:hypothetical protein